MLTNADRSLLEFEQRWPAPSYVKDERIRELGLSPARYYRRLNQLVDDPDAVAEFPMLVHRMWRMRDQRAAQRMRRTG